MFFIAAQMKQILKFGLKLKPKLNAWIFVFGIELVLNPVFKIEDSVFNCEEKTKHVIAFYKLFSEGHQCLWFYFQNDIENKYFLNGYLI